MTTHEPGLRERKKNETRLHLTKTALRLFAARGFDAVTVADVAAEAGVSEKTVFNYFPTKEDLVLGGRYAAEEALLDAIRDRAPGTSILEAVREQTHLVAAKMADLPIEKRVAFRKLILGSPTVSARMRETSHLHQDALAKLIAESLGDRDGEPLAQAIAGTIGQLTHLAYCGVTGWPDGKRRTPAEVIAVIDEGFALFAGGLGRLGVK